MRGGLPVILDKHSSVVLSILVIENSSTSKTELWSAADKVSEVGKSRGVGEEKLPVEDLRKQFVEVDANELATESEGVRPVDPAQVIDEVEVVLRLVLIGLGSWAELKSGSQESELVDTAGQVVCGPIDTCIGHRHRVDVDGAVIDAHIAEAKVVDQLWRC